MSAVESAGHRGIEELAHAIEEGARRISAAIYDQLTRIREFDASGGWELFGERSCAQWLSRRVGLSPVTARERVRVARALATLRRVDDALRCGDLSYSKARAITRVATSENEESLLALAKTLNSADLERFCRAMRTHPASRRGWDECFARKRSIAGTGLVRIEIQLRATEAETVWLALLNGARGAAAAAGIAPDSVSLVQAVLLFACALLRDAMFDDGPLSETAGSIPTREATPAGIKTTQPVAPRETSETPVAPKPVPHASSPPTAAKRGSPHAGELAVCVPTQPCTPMNQDETKPEAPREPGGPPSARV